MAPRRYLQKPDDLTVAALRRLSAGNSDFERAYTWLAQSVAALDELNRTTMDAVQLRQNQGAAAVLAEFLDEVAGREASAQGALTSRRTGSA